MLNNIKLSKRFRLIHAASQWSRDLTGRHDVDCCCYDGAEINKWNVKKMQIGWVTARFISTSHTTKQIVTGVISQWWALFPSVAGILLIAYAALGQ